MEMGRCQSCGKDAGLLMSYCDVCTPHKEPFRFIDRCERCGTMILPDSLYCKACGTPEASSLTIFDHEKQTVTKHTIEAAIAKAAAVPANRSQATGMRARMFSMLNMI